MEFLFNHYIFSARTLAGRNLALRAAQRVLRGAATNLFVSRIALDNAYDVELHRFASELPADCPD